MKGVCFALELRRCESGAGQVLAKTNKEEEKLAGSSGSLGKTPPMRHEEVLPFVDGIPITIVLWNTKGFSTFPR